MTEFVGRVQLDASGKTNSFEFNPTLLAALEIGVWDKIKFYPEAGFIIPRSCEFDYISVFTYFLLSNFGYVLGDFRLLCGAGYVFTRISSDGGQKAMNNGNGTDYFYLPSETSTSYNFVESLGVEYFLYQLDFSIKAQGEIYNLADSEKRAYSYMISLHYHFDAPGIFSE